MKNGRDINIVESATEHHGKPTTARHAVIVGIDQYTDPSIRDLSFAAADARAIYDVLTDKTLGRFEEKNVELLINEDATYFGIKEAIVDNLAARARPDDTVVIYYAGHGAPAHASGATSSDAMEKYFIPYDANADKLRSRGIAMSDIHEWFGFIRSRRVMFFIDSCYSGAAGGRTFEDPSQQNRAILTDEFLDDISGSGRTVITACDINQISLELPELGHGLFTHYLVEGLKGAADTNKDGLVSIDELYSYLYKKVSEHALLLRAHMEPVKRGDVKGEVYLTRYETDAQRKAKALVLEADNAIEAMDWDKALIMLEEALKYDENHTGAKDSLNGVRSRQQALRDKQNDRVAKLEYFEENGELTLVEYDQMLQLLLQSKELLSSEERRKQRRILQLLDGEIQLSSYLASYRRTKPALSSTEPLSDEILPDNSSNDSIAQSNDVETKSSELEESYNKPQVDLACEKDSDTSSIHKTPQIKIDAQANKQKILTTSKASNLRWKILISITLIVILGCAAYYYPIWIQDTKKAEQEKRILEAEQVHSWNVATITNTIDGYTKYIALPYATPDNSREAEDRIKALKNKSDDVRGDFNNEFFESFPSTENVPQGAVILNGQMWTVKDNQQDVNWQEAKAYCEQLVLGNYTDWDLAGIDALEALYDPNVWYSPQDAPDSLVRIKAPIQLSDIFVWSKDGSAAGFSYGVVFMSDIGKRRRSLEYSRNINQRALCVRNP